MKELVYLNKYLFKYKYHLLSGILLVFLNNIFATLVAPLAGKSFNLIAEFLSANENTKNLSQKAIIQSTFQSQLIQYVALIIGTSVIAGVFLYFQRKTLIGMSRRIEFDLKNEIYEHYQNLPLSFYKRNNTGDIMNRISEDVSQVRNYLGPCLMYGLNLIAIFAVTIPFMVAVNLKLTLYSLLPLPLLALSIYLVNSRITKQSEKIQKSQSDLSTHVQEAFSGIRVLKSFVREKDSTQQYIDKSETYRVHAIGLSKVQALFFPIILTLIGASTILVVYIGGEEVIKGKLAYGNIAEFFIYLNRMSWPVASLGWISSLIQRAEVSQGRINEFLKVTSEVTNGTIRPNEIKGEIEFNNVSFTYPDTGIKALKNCSFKINPGDRMAIVGNTGSGKSTIAQLLCRMYDVQSGEILLDGIPLKKLEVSFYRSNLGYVPQDVFLFSDTIKNNIAFGTDNPTDELLIQASKDADLHDNIVSFPNRYNTIIGEKGITLSGGQKQRLSIARAIVRNPQLLILDDCLSAVDTSTENTILKNLNRIMDTKTSILISHRISTAKLATKIIVLDEGAIAEYGNHNELMDKKGLYYALYQKQLSEEEIN